MNSCNTRLNGIIVITVYSNILITIHWSAKVVMLYIMSHWPHGRLSWQQPPVQPVTKSGRHNHLSISVFANNTCHKNNAIIPWPRSFYVTMILLLHRVAAVYIHKVCSFMGVRKMDSRYAFMRIRHRLHVLVCNRQRNPDIQGHYRLPYASIIVCCSHHLIGIHAYFTHMRDRQHLTYHP